MLGTDVLPTILFIFSMMTSSFHVNYIQWRGFGAIRFAEPSVYAKDSLDVLCKCTLVLWKVSGRNIYQNLSSAYIPKMNLPAVHVKYFLFLLDNTI